MEKVSLAAADATRRVRTADHHAIEMNQEDGPHYGKSYRGMSLCRFRIADHDENGENRARRWSAVRTLH